ncbi:MAG: hypothetical protein JWN72_2001 [Thermoleophilia bacterium]|nr:hypothetical protein [Thermoleophilia bacterium]
MSNSIGSSAPQPKSLSAEGRQVRTNAVLILGTSADDSERGKLESVRIADAGGDIYDIYYGPSLRAVAGASSHALTVALGVLDAKAGTTVKVNDYGHEALRAKKIDAAHPDASRVDILQAALRDVELYASDMHHGAYPTNGAWVPGEAGLAGHHVAFPKAENAGIQHAQETFRRVAGEAGSLRGSIDDDGVVDASEEADIRSLISRLDAEGSTLADVAAATRKRLASE